MSATSTPKRQINIIRQHGSLTARGLVAEAVLQVRDRLSALFRRKRMARFEELFPQVPYEEILDVGGTFEFWEGTTRRVTIVNPSVPASIHGTVTSVTGDGRQIAFSDRSFALAFSNSAIEHVPSRQDMEKFAREMRRIGSGVYCQTPNRWFPFDVHYFCLFLHWWPRLLRHYYIARYLTGWGWTFRPDRAAVQDWADHVNLLGKKEFECLFPDCSIEEEKFFGMTKSFIAVRCKDYDR